MIHPLGTKMRLSNPSDSCWDISVWTIMVDKPTERQADLLTNWHCQPQSLAASMAKGPLTPTAGRGKPTAVQFNHWNTSTAYTLTAVCDFYGLGELLWDVNNKVIHHCCYSVLTCIVAVVMCGVIAVIGRTYVIGSKKQAKCFLVCVLIHFAIFSGYDMVINYTENALYVKRAVLKGLHNTE